jgi:AcrR family transcriptional regulator
MSQDAAKPGPGRPPDPNLDNRVYSATLELYAEAGWAGFSLDVLSRRAKVGKATLYSKWGSKEKVIVAALAHRRKSEPHFEPTGALRADLLGMARGILGSYLGRDGLVVLRAQVEAKVYPDLFGREMDRVGRRRTETGRSIVLSAIERGELPEGTSPALILDAVAGTLTNHVLSTPVDKMPALADGLDAYTERIVDFVLAAAGYRPTTPKPGA